MATSFVCSACHNSQADGQCPNCSQVLCQTCYNVHQCESAPVTETEVAANLQCSNCVVEPAGCVCLCKFPCAVFCQECYKKHSGGLPIHFNLPMRYLQRLKSYEEFMMRKTRYSSMQRLYTDITQSVLQIGDFRRQLEANLKEVEGQIEAMRSKMALEVVSAQDAMTEQERLLSDNFTAILMSDYHSTSELTRMIDANYPTSQPFRSHLDIKPVVQALNQAASFECPLLNQFRPVLPAQASQRLLPGGSTASPRICNMCTSPYSSPPLAEQEAMQKLNSGVWTDFCSLKCLEQFKQLCLLDS